MQLESSVYAGKTRDPLFVKSDSELRIGTVLSKHGSIRRRGFAAVGKQRLLLTEVFFFFFSFLIFNVSFNIFLKFWKYLTLLNAFSGFYGDALDLELFFSIQLSVFFLFFFF